MLTAAWFSLSVACFVSVGADAGTSLRAVSMGIHQANAVSDSAMLQGTLYLLGQNSRGQTRLFRQEKPGAPTVELGIKLTQRKEARLLAWSSSSSPTLIILGGTDDNGPLSIVEQVHLQSATVEQLPPLPLMRHRFGALILQNKLYVAGGRHLWGTVANVEVFDLNHRTWHVQAPLIQARECELVAFNGEVFALGGYANRDLGIVRFIERLAVSRNTVVGMMPVAVSRFAATIDEEGQVIVVGDFLHTSQVLRFALPGTSLSSSWPSLSLTNQNSRHLSDSDYTKVTTWKEENASIAPRRGARAHLLKDGILVVGGESMGQPTVRIELLLFSESKGSPSTVLSDASLTR